MSNLISRHQRNETIRKFRMRAEYHQKKVDILVMIDRWLVPELESSDKDWLFSEETIGKILAKG